MKRLICQSNIIYEKALPWSLQNSICAFYNFFKLLQWIITKKKKIWKWLLIASLNSQSCSFLKGLHFKFWAQNNFILIYVWSGGLRCTSQMCPPQGLCILLSMTSLFSQAWIYVPFQVNSDVPFPRPTPPSPDLVFTTIHSYNYLLWVDLQEEGLKFLR